ncbi:MAG: orotidine 5'-phosphate decarboxylase / HUMPS family protein [Vagococcus sp.]|uniref:orotidine 5'-phosphate decarboxylase / HUMPS family protein n=1 Tax=Vagococcus TaxID=2737 RepID=UPI002FCAB5F3
MKLQVAIDRVSLEEATRLVTQLDGVVDVIEMGTSLVKDYGIVGMKELRKAATKSELLIDIKTIDEGEYEFKQGFTQGADILTVMGASSIETIRVCYQTSQLFGKQMMIDLLEVSNEKIEKLLEFEEAIFCLHHSVDKLGKWQVVDSVLEFEKKFPSLTHTAIAGGITLNNLEELKQKTKIEQVVVGSNIIKAENIVAEAKKFMERKTNDL